MGEGTQRRNRDPQGDNRLLRKATQTNLLGHLARAAHPALLILVTRSYSVEAWGLYVIGYAAMQLLAKLALQGLHRGFLYWVPRARLSKLPPGIVAGTARVVLASIPLSIAVALLAPWVAQMRGIDEAARTWQWMALGVPALALCELLTHVSVACGTIKVQVWLRDFVIPMSIVITALGLHALGQAELGLALAFVLSSWLGAIVIAVASLRALQARGIELAPSWRLPAELRSYARPAWAAELLMELQYRLDTLVLALFVEPSLVGIYGIANQFGNTVRSLRGTLAPMLTALFSDAAHQTQRARLAGTYTYATTVAVLTQLPLVALFAIYGRPLLALFGEQYVDGYAAVLLLSLGWLAYSWLGSAEQVIGGYGRSAWLLSSTTLGVALETALLFALCPGFGLLGASCAVVLTFLSVGTAQLYLSYRLNGNQLPLTGAVLEPALTLLVSGTAAGLCFASFPPLDPGWLRGALALAAFTLAYAPLAWRAFSTNPATLSRAATR